MKVLPVRLEYAYDDWAIYKLGKALGKPESEIAIFAKHAMNYKNLFDPETKLMRGRNEDGSFQSPFNPLKWEMLLRKATAGIIPGRFSMTRRD